MAKNLDEAMAEIEKNSAENLARKRISMLLDKGSFVEKGRFVLADEGQLGDGVLTGYGTLNAKLVFVYAMDKDISLGSLSYENTKKILGIYEDAFKVGAPVVAFLDSAGIRISESFKAIDGFGELVKKILYYKDRLVTLTAVFSDISGVSSLLVNASDFSVKLKNTDVSLVHKGLLGYDEELALKNGTVDLLAENEEEAIDFIKDMLGILPEVKSKKPVVFDMTDELNRELVHTDMKDISSFILDLFDGENVKELKKDYSEDVHTFLGTIGGILTFVVVTSSNYDYLSYDGIKKISAFVKKADGLKISILTIVDTKGFETDTSSEKKNFSSEFFNLVEAYTKANVPKITLYAGECVGSAYFAMASKHIASDFVFAFDDAKFSLIDKEAWVKTLYRDEIIKNYDDKDYIKKLIDSYELDQMNVFNLAALGYVDDVIEKAAARKRIIAVLDMLYTKGE